MHRVSSLIRYHILILDILIKRPEVRIPDDSEGDDSESKILCQEKENKKTRKNG